MKVILRNECKCISIRTFQICSTVWVRIGVSAVVMVLLRIATCLKIETETAVLLLLLLLLSLLTASGYVPGGSGTTVHNTIHKKHKIQTQNKICYGQK